MRVGQITDPLAAVMGLGSARRRGRNLRGARSRVDRCCVDVPETPDCGACEDVCQSPTHLECVAHDRASEASTRYTIARDALVDGTSLRLLARDRLVRRYVDMRTNGGRRCVPYKLFAGPRSSVPCWRGFQDVVAVLR